MIILLSPSKQMTFREDFHEKLMSEPQFEPDACKLATAISEYDILKLSKVLKCNKTIARTSIDMAYSFINSETKS